MRKKLFLNILIICLSGCAIKQKEILTSIPDGCLRYTYWDYSYEGNYIYNEKGFIDSMTIFEVIDNKSALIQLKDIRQIYYVKGNFKDAYNNELVSLRGEKYICLKPTGKTYSYKTAIGGKNVVPIAEMVQFEQVWDVYVY